MTLSVDLFVHLSSVPGSQARHHHICFTDSSAIAVGGSLWVTRGYFHREKYHSDCKNGRGEASRLANY